MKAKQLVVALVLLIALGGIALFLRSRNTTSWRETATSTESKVLNFSLNDVAQVAMKGSGSEVNLVKKDDVWKVAERFDYPADFDQIAALVRRLWELRPAQDVKVGPSQFAHLQLTEPTNDANSGVLVDLIGKDEKRIAALLLGEQQMRDSGQGFGGMPAGRYVSPRDGSNRVFLISETFNEIQTKPEQWLNRDFIQIQKPKSIAVAGPNPNMNWKLVRDNESAPWKFADAKPGEELDASKASAVGSLLANPSFADILDPKIQPTESGLDKPSMMRVETFDNFVYDLRIGKLMGNNYPVAITVNADLPKERTPAKDEKPEDKTKLDHQFEAIQKPLRDKLQRERKIDKWTYLMTKGTIEQLIKDRSALLPEKKASSSATPHAGSVAPLPKKTK
jgi:Domain of unknown function (DUF4340)